MITLVTSRPLSKELAEAGLKRETKFCWVSPDGKNFTIKYMDNPKFRYAGSVYPAFLPVELMGVLPEMIEFEYKRPIVGFLNIAKIDGKYKINYQDMSGRSILPLLASKTPANALAKCLLYLIQNQIIKVK